MSIVAAFLMCLHSMFGTGHKYSTDEINAAKAQVFQEKGITANDPGYNGYIVVVDTIYQN